MIRVLGKLVLVLLAALAGLGAAELLSTMPAFRSAAGKLFGRGELVSVTDGVGVYETDLIGAAGGDPRSIASTANLMRLASGEHVAEEDIEREMTLLRFQFPNEKAFAETLDASGLSRPSLRNQLVQNLRARQWIEKEITPHLSVTETDARKFYEANVARFTLPQRYRASHIFLAAPGGTPPEDVETKQSDIQGLAMRILAGENFAVVAAEASEDEATKSRGGDLGPFSGWRVTPEFLAEVEKLAVGEISPPIRSPLGFHIVQLTNAWPPRQLPFEEARPEIETELMNQRRAAAVTALRDRPGAGTPVGAAR